MSPLKLFAAAILASGVATPVLAQGAVISEPGYCAFFYPTANCNNKGPGNPYTDPNWRRDGGDWGAVQSTELDRWRCAEATTQQAPVAILRLTLRSRHSASVRAVFVQERSSCAAVGVVGHAPQEQ